MLYWIHTEAVLIRHSAHVEAQIGSGSSAKVCREIPWDEVTVARRMIKQMKEEKFVEFTKLYITKRCYR